MKTIVLDGSVALFHFGIETPCMKWRTSTISVENQAANNKTKRIPTWLGCTVLFGWRGVGGEGELGTLRPSHPLQLFFSVTLRRQINFTIKVGSNIWTNMALKNEKAKVKSLYLLVYWLFSVLWKMRVKVNLWEHLGFKAHKRLMISTTLTPR